MKLAKCPECNNLCEHVPDAASVLKISGEFRKIGGWFCEWCGLSWFKEKKSGKQRAELRKAKAKKYKSKSVSGVKE